MALTDIIKKVFGTRNERQVKKVRPLVERINELAPRFEKKRDEELTARTAHFRERLGNGEKLDDLLPEAFALVREASWRKLRMRHFDVQLIGGIFLHRGSITEMKTGEGKTLVATLPLYLNALTGRGAHLVTVNDYLASRDAEWMSKVYKFLGMSVGVIVHGLEDHERKENYAADITYGTNNEFGFDYLRDNMKYSLDRYVQRELHYAIVDEVDSILIDEARTPLIISGQAEDSSELYYKIDDVVRHLRKELDYTVDEKAQAATLTDDGVERVEGMLRTRGILEKGDLYTPENIEQLHHVTQAIRAHTLYKRDVNYLVSEGKVLIIDEFTGRLMPGRRWSDGLHQAVEAKEGVRIKAEQQTLATISFQNYFRLYEKLGGMTGTADTEAAEFMSTYKREVMVIPTNRSMVRKDHQDVIFKNEPAKFRAVVEEIADCYQRRQPVLVGTISVEKSEVLSQLLKRKGIPHTVLNAKYHKKEAEIVAQAGRAGAITIATNMAGRGTDIVLGGNPEALTRSHFLGLGLPVVDETTDEYAAKLKEFQALCAEERKVVMGAGGLHILGTERHESRRIDNQLRGRSGRQGDPGSSRFFLSLEDDLMRIFGSDRIGKIMDTLGMEEDEPIEHRWVSKAIENAQKKVEGHHFDMRKHLLEYDDVMDMQRKTVYALRRKILGDEGVEEMLLDMAEDLVLDVLAVHTPQGGRNEDWNLEGLTEAVRNQFNVSLLLDPEATYGHEQVQDLVWGEVEKSFRARIAMLEPLADSINDRHLDDDPNWKKISGRDLYFQMARDVYLREIDLRWREHLQNMEQLREGIGLRGYAQKDPKKEYQREGYDIFAGMMGTIKANCIRILFRVVVDSEEQVRALAPRRRAPEKLQLHRGESAAAGGGGDGAGAAPRAEEKPQTFRREGPKVGRNDPCPCGSGKKFKKCCMLKEQPGAPA
ncbi:MAG: preprotein translocase subunit SecA [Myxococcota bacterium]|jgi:preprotein translocase subunit SecA|nr:preprotein translocase subunit SecA [Myxococcota bacterium]